MRIPRLHPWLSTEGLLNWVHESPSVSDHQRRLAVWLTHIGPFPAYRVAELLGVSKQAVWSWVGGYNRTGPGAFGVSGRGGRRWSFLSLEEEAHLLNSLREKALRGEIVTAKHCYQEVCQAVGKIVSMDYVYKVLRRQGWRKLAPRPRHVSANPQAQAEFKKTSGKSSPKLARIGRKTRR